MLISDLINTGSKKLKEEKILSHLLDSELILSNLLNQSRESLLTRDKKKISKDQINKYNSLIARRRKKEPIAYILKRKEFWNSKFIVDKNTLIPRPETELLVEKIVKYYKGCKPYILDIGTGSGCIIISILQELNKATGIGIDISKKAIKIAELNAKNSKILDRLKFLNRSVDQVHCRKFSLIVSNPPYILSHQIKNLSDDVKKYEPKIALDGGNDGLDVIKKVIYKAKDILKYKGLLALEIGHGQFKQVSQILKKNRFREKFLIKDYRNNIRCILAILEN